MGRASGKCDNIALGSVDTGQCGHFRMYVHTVDTFARELSFIIILIGICINWEILLHITASDSTTDQSW